MAGSFSFVVNDTSPALNFFPFSDTLSTPNFFAGWNPCFSASACSTHPGQQGNGTSSHITSLDGAAFSVQWWGNGIQLTGFVAGPVTYDLQLDGQTNSSISPSSGTTLLASYDNLQPTNHTLSLIVHNPTNSSSALIGIYHALINVNSTSPNVTFYTTTIDDTALPFTGQWSFLDDSSLSPLDSTYHTTSNAGDSVSLNFSGTAITVFGYRDTTSGNYSVQLDNETVILNAASSSKEATTLFFRTGLNDSFVHTLTITNEDNSLLAIGSVNITKVSSRSSNPTSALSRGSHRSTVIAITLAAILGSLVLLISLFCLWRRRRQFGRILHQRRLFVPPNGNNHSKVLDIVRGPEVDDFEDMYHDKGPTTINRRAATNGSGSMSFTLDLPIQSRPSLLASQRGDYSGNSAQELPRSPTVSLGRTGTHARESSRGVPFPEAFSAEGSDNIGARQPPLPGVQDQATVTTNQISSPPQDQETQEEHAESQTFELSPVVPAPALPRVSAVAGVIPTQESSERSQLSYSFLDITASSRESSVRHTGPNASSSSSSSGSLQRRNQEPFSSTRRISLPFALGFPTGLRHVTAPSDPSSANIEFPLIASNIRPLPQIPQGMVGPHTVSAEEFPMPPRPPRSTIRPYTQSSPPLHIRTQTSEHQQLPRSVSVTTAPTSALSTSNRVPHIIIHPSTLLRPLRNSSGVSPTESVPVTVSDIHFRHSSDDEPVDPESRRTSTGVGEHPPPHPPLPQRPYTSPFIMQKLFGSQMSPLSDGQSSMQTPGAGPSKQRDRDPPTS